jgi:hypothetical protein
MTTLATAYEPPPARVAVTAHAMPATDPPYDDGEPDAPRPDRPLRPYPHANTFLRLVRSPGDDLDAPERTDREALEDPLPRAAMLTRVVLEAINGTRPVGQLMSWVSPEVLGVIHSMAASRAARPTATALRRVLVSEPLPGIAEVTAIVQRGPRAEALALRLEGLDGRWVVTALQRA